jgi:hypothetical protein
MLHLGTDGFKVQRPQVLDSTPKVGLPNIIDPTVSMQFKAVVMRSQIIVLWNSIVCCQGKMAQVGN